MDYQQKQELVRRIEDEHGVHELFKKLGFKNISRKGSNVYCTCPFHEGADNPTGFAYSNGFGFCFTHCHRKMDLYSIVMEANNCEFTDAVTYLADLVGMEVDFTVKPKIITDGNFNRDFLSQLKRVKKNKQRTGWKPIDPNILENFAPLLHKRLRKWGFDNNTRDYFNLGYAQDGYLENRITIPIDYIDGSIVTVSGRSVLPDTVIEENGEKRYKIWFDTEKSVTLYNISRADPFIELSGEVKVVEGFKSVWRLHQWGIYDVIATMGSSLSNEQRDILLKRGAKIIPCGDRDLAGQALNKQIYDECHKYSDVEIMDMYLLNVSEKSSIDNITKSQYEFLYKNKK